MCVSDTRVGVVSEEGGGRWKGGSVDQGNGLRGNPGELVRVAAQCFIILSRRLIRHRRRTRVHGDVVLFNRGLTAATGLPHFTSNKTFD